MIEVTQTDWVKQCIHHRNEKKKTPPTMSNTIHRHQQRLLVACNESCNKLYTGSNNPPNRILTEAMKMKNMFVENRSLVRSFDDLLMISRSKKR
mmetsp:Transcript_27166/g.31161  ORF Transcript_27166/g.31161 Transcript_27166/m.31161 type:complete len:94 (+) Transcript_27166:153-434(+)